MPATSVRRVDEPARRPPTGATPPPPSAPSADPRGGLLDCTAIHPQTLAEVTEEVAREVLAAHRGLWPSLARTAYVAGPDRSECARAVQCQPVPTARQAQSGHPSGHLHLQRHDLDEVDEPAGSTGSPAEGAGSPVDAVLDTTAPLAVVAELIAAGVARDLLDCVAAAERHRSEQLTVALVTNRRIAMAQGIVMAQRRVTPEQALDQLKASSQNHNRKLRDIAETVILTGALPPWRATPPAGGPWAPSSQGGGTS